MLHDLMANLSEPEIKCLDKGHVRLVDVMPRLAPEGQTTADFAIVQAARVSYGAGTKTVNEDRGLIRYLMRHSHTTPLEMVKFKFHLKTPTFTARQIFRHRNSSANEYSGRYSVMPDEFYIPEHFRSQSAVNKQGGEAALDFETDQQFLAYLRQHCEQTYKEYQDMLAKGVSRELARITLPLNVYTEFYWSIDLHNLLHFLALRCDEHSQYEVRVFADAILSLIKPLVPFAIEAWEDYYVSRGAVKLTRLEVEALRRQLAGLSQHVDGYIRAESIESDNKREQAEWLEKATKLGLVP